MIAAADVTAGEESPDSEGSVLVNGQRGRPQGKCHRKYTAEVSMRKLVRVKRCGKSAPPSW